MSSSSAAVRELVLRSDQSLADIHEHVASHWRAWWKAWCTWSGEDASMAVEPVVQRIADAQINLPGQDEWRKDDARPGLWRHVSGEALTTFAKHLVRRTGGTFSHEGDWALTAASAALDDLATRWWPAAEPSSASDGQICLEDALHPLLGSVLVSVPAWGVHWLIPPACTRAWSSATSGVTPKTAEPVDALMAVLEPCGVALQLGIGHVDIAVGDLLELHVGDVVRFPALLKDPLPLLASKPDGQSDELMQGRLGHRDGRLAVQLVSRARAK